MTFEELYALAVATLNPRRLSPTVEVGGVAAAILSDNGRIYTGVCIDTACSMGFCAEHAAVAAMITAGDSRILRVVAVNWDSAILAPCGRCREFMAQVHPDNLTAEVMLSGNRIVTLSALPPEFWAAGLTMEELPG